MRARRLIMSQRALNDLLGIYNHIADDNPAAANALLADLNRKIDQLAQSGARGVKREYHPGLSAFVHRNRCIYFLVGDTTFTVLRVLHGHQNVSPDDFQTSEN